MFKKFDLYGTSMFNQGNHIFIVCLIVLYLYSCSKHKLSTIQPDEPCLFCHVNILIHFQSFFVYSISILLFMNGLPLQVTVSMNKLRGECPEKWKVVSSQLFWLWVYITLNQPSGNNSLSTNNLRKIDQYGILGNYCIYSAISWVIFTQIDANVQWNLIPVGGLGL